MRKGLGKMRQLEVSQLWVQQKVAEGHVKLVKVAGEDNAVDALTKHVDASGIRHHCEKVGICVSADRHELALKA